MLQRRLPVSDDALLAALTTAEHVHRARFRRAADRDRFLLGRATLRIELGRRLGCAPQLVPISTAEHGKPFVLGGPEFTVSHSGDVVLVAVSEAPVGIDVEQVVPDLIDDLVGYLSPRERADLAALGPGMRARGACTAWTIREAIGKLFGMGLALPRTCCDVAVDRAAILAAHEPPVAGAEIALAAIDVADDHVATLAVAAATCTVVG